MDLTDKALDKLLSLSTREEQHAFLAGWKLRDEYASLVQEFVKQTAVHTETVPVQLPLPTPKPVEPIAPAISPYIGQFKAREAGYKMKHRGLRADVLRALYTGPLTYMALGNALQVTGTPLRSSLNKLMQKQFVERMLNGPHEVFKLTTPKGQEEAAIYVARPGMKAKATRGVFGTSNR